MFPCFVAVRRDFYRSCQRGQGGDWSKKWIVLNVSELKIVLLFILRFRFFYRTIMNTVSWVHYAG